MLLGQYYLYDICIHFLTFLLLFAFTIWYNSPYLVYITFVCILTHVCIRIKIGRRTRLKTSELIKLLKKNHCFLIEHGKRHDRWYSPVSEKAFILPRHRSKEIPSGTANQILKEAGLK